MPDRGELRRPRPAGRGAPDRFREATAAKQITTDIKVYPGVGHSFANTIPGQPLLRITGFGYDRAATEDAWSRVFAFFGEHLGAGATT
jgi:carboxymethylenebutenolidase